MSTSFVCVGIPGPYCVPSRVDALVRRVTSLTVGRGPIVTVAHPYEWRRAVIEHEQRTWYVGPEQFTLDDEELAGGCTEGPD